MATRQLFNATTQQVEEATLTVDANNEIVATFADGGVLKFPAGLSAEQLDELVRLHEEQNKGQEIVTPEAEAAKAAERAASLALIGEAEGDATPESQSNDEAPANPTE